MAKPPTQFKAEKSSRSGRLISRSDIGTDIRKGRSGMAEKTKNEGVIFISPSSRSWVAATNVGSKTKAGRGIVNALVQGTSGKTTAWAYTAAILIDSLKAGLPVQELEDLRSSLGVQMERLVPILGISKATLHRRIAAGRLGPTDSDRVIRFAKLLGQAVVVMESLENARKWLSSPQRGLGGAIPLEYAETEVGAREVENLLGRIEYGVYA